MDRRSQGSPTRILYHHGSCWNIQGISLRRDKTAFEPRHPIHASEQTPVFPCPVCGDNVEGCHSIRMKGKKFGTEDIVIPCPKCGTFHITNRAKGGDYVQNVRETGKSYDMFSRVNATLDRIRESESQPSRKRAELYTYNARELRIAILSMKSCTYRTWPPSGTCVMS